jgi:hypothetical protein
MTESRTSNRTAPAPRPSERPITLKRLRVESQFLEETKGLERKERDRYGSQLWNLMRLDFAPKVKLIDLVGPRVDAAIDTEHEGSIRSVVDHYHGRPDRADLHQVLKFFSVYLLQRARREPSFAKQQFLLFKAVDLLRMITQYSTWCVHRDAEALVYAIFDDLGTQKEERFAKYRDRELRIYPLMKKLHEVPRDFVLRLELADELGRQTSFFDALVQYDFLRRFYPRFYTASNLERQLGVIYSRVAGLFQNMLDNLGRDYRDARKLNGFIERYNRQFATRKDSLVPFTQDGKGTADRVARGLRHTAENWYRRALAVKVLPAETLVQNAAAFARNLAGERRHKEALNVLMENYRYWSGIGQSVESLQRRINYLEQLTKIAGQAGKRDQVNWANLEQRDHLAKLDELIRQSESYRKRREEILREAREGAEEPEPPALAAAVTRAAPARGRRAAAAPSEE